MHEESNNTKKLGKGIFYGIVLVLAIFIINIGSLSVFDNFKDRDDDDQEYFDTYGCNVLGLTMHGDVVNYVSSNNQTDEEETVGYADVISSDDIVYQIKEAEYDNNIRAILLDVDSYGGVPVAGEEIANAVFKSTKPVVAVIRQSALSAAYWAISGADRIFASKNSDIGSIGVTASYLENVDKNKFEGLNYVDLSSGLYKDAGNPDRTLTQKEKDLILRDVKITHENFIQDVAVKRDISIEKMREIADGSSVLGETAKALGLIDEIGSFDEAEKYIDGIIGEEPAVCWY